VLLELHAGTDGIDQKRAVDSIRASAKWLIHPGEADLFLAGQVLSWHAGRIAALRPRDHSHDVLIAIGAGQSRSVLVTENPRDMNRWADALKRRAGMRIRVMQPRLDA
jgi:hypothetical protein